MADPVHLGSAPEPRTPVKTRRAQPLLQCELRTAWQTVGSLVRGLQVVVRDPDAEVMHVGKPMLPVKNCSTPASFRYEVSAVPVDLRQPSPSLRSSVSSRLRRAVRSS